MRQKWEQKKVEFGDKAENKEEAVFPNFTWHKNSHPGIIVWVETKL